MKPCRIIAFAVILSSVAAGAENHTWKTGKLLDVNTNSYSTGGKSSTAGVDASGSPTLTTNDTTWNHERWTYIVEDEKYVYTLSHVLSFRWSKECRLIVGESVQFEVKKSDAWIKDLDGRIHKLHLDKQAVKAAK
jgi:hypothetical protein